MGQAKLTPEAAILSTPESGIDTGKISFPIKEIPNYESQPIEYVLNFIIRRPS